MPTRAAVAAAAALFLSGAGSASEAVCRRHDDVDDFSALQASLALHKHADEALRQASDEVHIISTVFCEDATLWEVELLFYSAQRVGQRGPITGIIDNCSQDMEQHIRARYATLGLPKQYKVQFTHTTAMRYVGKPAAVQQWFTNFGPERDIVAVVDPDFIFTRPLSATVDRMAINGEPERKERVRPGIVAAELWVTFLWQANATGPLSTAFHGHFLGKPERFRNWTDDEVLLYACSGSRLGPSGCDGITQREFYDYHQTGPPYIAHVDDWKSWLLPNWFGIAGRLVNSGLYMKYFVDMMSWSLATMHAGRRQTVARNLQLVQHEPVQDWSGLDKGTKNPCEDSMDEVLSQPDLPTFIHYTGVYPEWDKHLFQGQVFERCDRSAPQEEGMEPDGMTQMLSTEVNLTNKRDAFVSCIARRMLAGGIRRACAGRSAAKLVEKIVKGFVL